MTGLRLMLFDRTSRGHAMCYLWRMGGALYRQLDRLDGYFGVSCWSEGLDWLARFQPHRPIREVQFWGPGRWGSALVDQEALDQRCLEESHPLHPTLVAVQRRLEPEGLWWFRTCETLGATSGQRLAYALSDFLGCRVAGHTHIIGFYQSGLHSLAPGEQPGWDAREAVCEEEALPHCSHRHTPRFVTERPWDPSGNVTRSCPETVPRPTSSTPTTETRTHAACPPTSPPWRKLIFPRFRGHPNRVRSYP